MAQELLYTSAPQGLRPGSRGFCTVAATQGLSPLVIDRLEALSGYREVFGPHDAQASLNPVCVSHVRVMLGGQNVSLLSRVAAYGADYTDRTNKLAHHVLLEAPDHPQGGPAWLAAQPAFLRSTWDGTVAWLPPGKTVPRGDGPPAPCALWRDITGDAGWGGVLVDAFLADPTRPTYLVYPVGQEVAGLLEESLALLPPHRRWEITFSTYFTGLPQDVACLWRCVLKDSPEAKAAARLPNALVIDVTSRLGPAPAGSYVQAARTGKPATSTLPPPPLPGGYRAPPPPVAPLPVTQPRVRVELVEDDRYSGPSEYQLRDENRPDPATPGAPPPPPPPRRSRHRTPDAPAKTSTGLLVAGIVAVPVVLGVILFASSFFQTEPKPLAANATNTTTPSDEFPGMTTPRRTHNPPQRQPQPHPSAVPVQPVPIQLVPPKPVATAIESPKPERHGTRPRVKPTLVDPPPDPDPPQREPENTVKYITLGPKGTGPVSLGEHGLTSLQGAEMFAASGGAASFTSEADAQGLHVKMRDERFAEDLKLGTFSLKDKSLMFEWVAEPLSADKQQFLRLGVLSIPHALGRLHIAFTKPVALPEIPLPEMKGQLSLHSLKAVEPGPAPEELEKLIRRSHPSRILLRFEETLPPRPPKTSPEPVAQALLFVALVDKAGTAEDGRRKFELTADLGKEFSFQPERVQVEAEPRKPAAVPNVLLEEKGGPTVASAQGLHLPRLKLVWRDDETETLAELKLIVPRPDANQRSGDELIPFKQVEERRKAVEGLLGSFGTDGSKPVGRANLEETLKRLKRLSALLKANARVSAEFVETLGGVTITRMTFGSMEDEARGEGHGARGE